MGCGVKPNTYGVRPYMYVRTWECRGVGLRVPELWPLGDWAVRLGVQKLEVASDAILVQTQMSLGVPKKSLRLLWKLCGPNFMTYDL